MIVIVDYGQGNLFSIAQAMKKLGADAEISAKAQEILRAERVVLPGVGAFGTAMRHLSDLSLIEPLLEITANGTPLLGICLGMQLLAESSVEFGHHEGLGLIGGRVTKLPEGKGQPGAGRIPNVGWRRLHITAKDPLLSGLGREPMVYFVHSHALEAADPNVVSAILPVNGRDTVAAVRKGNIMGYQFHPENSGPIGLEFLRCFLSLPRAV